MHPKQYPAKKSGKKNPERRRFERRWPGSASHAAFYARGSPRKPSSFADFVRKPRRQGMLKKLMITTALSGALIGGAAAQATMDAPAANAPRANAPMASGDAKFINTQNTNQWLSSNFIGVDVIGPDNQKIGDVSDILFEKNGNVIAYVVGVGGFLGIGAKNVALAPSSFQVMADNAGTTGSASATHPDDVKLKLNMTKDQLQQAASFESKRDQEAKARSASQPNPPANRPDRPAPR
jgi:hypothetical protein